MRLPCHTYASTQAVFGQYNDQLSIYGDGTDLWTGNDEYGSIYLPGEPLTGIHLESIGQSQARSSRVPQLI